MIKRCVSIKLDLGQRRLCAISYTNYSKFKYLLPVVPLPEGCKLVGANKQVELTPRILGLQGLEGINRESGSGARQFTVIHHHARHVFKGQLCHGQPMLGRAQ